MEGSAIQDEQLDSALDPPVRIFERLSQIAGYTWDESAALTHSSYDNWLVTPPRHFYHTKRVEAMIPAAGRLTRDTIQACIWYPVCPQVL